MNKLKLSLAILLIVLLKKAEAQDISISKRKQLFDYNWKFYLGDNPQASSNNLNDSKWRNLNLPHDWSIEGKIDPNNASGSEGGFYPTGLGWYRKTFKLPASLKGKKISLYFEGVYMNAEVFVNGKSLGIRPYGYSAFSHELTPYLNFNKENVIVVKVDNSQQKNSRWYSGSGIYRHVWMVVNDPVHIDLWGTQITTPKVATNRATVEVRTSLKNETSVSQMVSLITNIYKKNAKVGTVAQNVELPANSLKEVTQTLTVANPKLWSPETPELYKASSTVLKGGKQLDANSSLFGIRLLSFSASTGFLLNGKHVILNGGCVHHDNGFLGAAAYDRAEIKKVELLKKAGFNAVRTAHNPPSEKFLEACDSIGLLVMDESFDGWKVSKQPNDYGKYFDQWWKEDIKAMVLRDRNHPSVFMWSTGNEVYEKTEDAQRLKITEMLANFVRQLDPTRPVTSAIVGGNSESHDPLYAAHDVSGYNYNMHMATKHHERTPSRIIVQTESFPKDAFYNWKMSQENKYILGDFVWSAIDYLGETGIGRYIYPGEALGEHWEESFQKDAFPWHGAYCGDIDLTGLRKPISHYRDLLYNEGKKLYMAVKEPNPLKDSIKLTPWAVWPSWESWTWPEQTGKNIEVEVYSRYPQVRLYLNNDLIGEKQVGREQEFKATFTLPYSPGLLKAVGVLNNKEQQSTFLKTAGKATKIRLAADRTKLKANGQDLSYITVEVTDKDGNLQHFADNLLTFNIKGAGHIAAVGNANLKDPDSYVLNSRKAWKGRATVIVKSAQDAGKIVLEVSAPGLAKSAITINSTR